MITKEIEYAGYKIEIHKHPIYEDYEFVIKSLDGHEVKCASTHPYEHPLDEESSAMIIIENL